MFTGIIEHTSPILSISEWRFSVKNNFWLTLKVWQSIAHDGACMSLESYDKDQYTFFVMQESLSKTNFQTKKVWDAFNIERCMKADDRVDGHFVSGHIDTTWKISCVEIQADNSLIIWVDFPDGFSKYTIKKWSIAINGVSLTIVDKKPGYISVSLIPITQEWTNLWNLEIGDIVNIEFDMLGKYILNGQHDS